jgi:2-methylisocitrate lyase-like PEP mutase family enzyme
MDQKTKAPESKAAQDSTAATFAALHAGSDILVLPNAWDAASAAVMEDAGARAVATSSAAVAWAHGYPDGDRLPLPNLIPTISAVARVVRVPVTADVEGGYTDDLARLADNVRAVIGAGAVGINLEDGARAPDLHARKIEAVRKAADGEGVALFINARTDTYLKRLFEGEAAEAETIRRAAQYRAAGADGVFVPGPTDEALIGRLAAAVEAPLNIMLLPGLPSAGRLQALGVRRLSSGGGPFRGAYAYLSNAVKAYLSDGLAAPFQIEGLGNLNQRFG